MKIYFASHIKEEMFENLKDGIPKTGSLIGVTQMARKK